MSAQKVSEIVGTNKTTLTVLENGRIDLCPIWIKRISKGHGISEMAFRQIIEAKDIVREEIVLEIGELLLNLVND